MRSLHVHELWFAPTSFSPLTRSLEGLHPSREVEFVASDSVDLQSEQRHIVLLRRALGKPIGCFE